MKRSVMGPAAAVLVSALFLGGSGCGDRSSHASGVSGAASAGNIGAAAPAAGARTSDPAGSAPAAARPAGAATPAKTGAAQKAAFYADTFSKRPTVPDMTRLGRRLFFDPALSGSGDMACGTCHDPAHAYGPPPGGVMVQRDGATRRLRTARAIPSLKYIQNAPPFNEHHFDESVDESVDQGPTGGHMWDGRADTLHDQARLPLFSSLEMANTSSDAIVENVEKGGYAQCVRSTFGDDVFESREKAFKAILMALEVFQQDPHEFYPYDSKYDGWLRGRIKLTASETRGLAWFNDPNGGNCASCHPSQIRNGTFPQFTDYGLIALGLPRNRDIPANQDEAYFDLGLCGPERTDLAGHARYCGLFKAPSLRNTSVRTSYFHNGIYHDLRQVIDFYVERDTHPGKFYPRGKGGSVQKFDDLPAQYRDNINTESPFGPDGRGRPLSKQQMDDALAFLKTLTDGYAGSQQPPVSTAPAASTASSGC